jgi:hypothetical protein
VEVRVAGVEGWIAFECDDRGQVEDITLRLGPLLGHVEATIGLDLSAMRDDLSRALSSPTLTGGTSIESVEHDFVFRIDIENGKGLARGRITTQFADDGRLDFALSTDQSYLGETLRQLDRLFSG